MSKSTSKQQLGQFYTTNYEYILSNMSIPPDITHIIEPFVGTGDLLKFIDSAKTNYIIETYDIDPKYENAVKRDTLNDPPDYTGRFVLTNPPYLARNKSKNKELYDKHGCNDLYKCFIMSLIESVCLGGIVIIPLNFVSSIRKADVELRMRFLEKYAIRTINIFEERVFDDTAYAVCSIQFSQKTEPKNEPIKIHIYPSRKTMNVELTPENNYTIGGEIYNLPYNDAYKVSRATRLAKENITNILLKCIDDNIDSQLGFKLADNDEVEKYVDNTPNLSARSYAVLCINKNMSLDEQARLVENINGYITRQRDAYNSLFLSNYRESSRKRISFDLAFNICNYMISASASV
jgi:hypothetical protein